MALSLRSIFLTSLMAFALIFSGCGTDSKKNSATGDSVSSSNNGDESVGSNSLDFEVNADSDSGQAGGLRTVYFGFNSARLSREARAALDANVEFLKSNSNVEVQVEGHCDERGGKQYNLALGESRAKSVRDYLVSQGVERGRVSTISFGKDRPLAFGHDEESWAQNRRGNFVVTAK